MELSPCDPRLNGDHSVCCQNESFPSRKLSPFAPENDVRGQGSWRPQSQTRAQRIHRVLPRDFLRLHIKDLNAETMTLFTTVTNKTPPCTSQTNLGRRRKVGKWVVIWGTEVFLSPSCGCPASLGISSLQTLEEISHRSEDLPPPCPPYTVLGRNSDRSWDAAKRATVSCQYLFGDLMEPTTFSIKLPHCPQE